MATVEVTIEVDSDGGATNDESIPVRGTVRRRDGAEEPFVGWLSLMVVLQEAVTPPDGHRA
jgi:hypothetical protein